MYMIRAAEAAALRRRAVLATAVVLLVPAIVQAQGNPGPSVELGIDSAGLPAPADSIDGVQGGVFQDGRLFLAGQPDEQAFARFRDLGVTAVVNLRTPAEMDNRQRVPFDEAALVSELEMDYVHIPLGGDDHPYDRKAVEQFAAVLKENPGPVLLHCTVAWRASHLWTAYLVLHQDYPLSEALGRGEAIAISPPPLEGLLGRPLTLVYDESSPP